MLWYLGLNYTHLALPVCWACGSSVTKAKELSVRNSSKESLKGIQDYASFFFNPKVKLVNYGIPNELCSVYYASFDAAVGMVRSRGPGEMIENCDIKSVFKTLSVHAGDFDLIDFQFEGQVFH